jgi:hypothetical protein
MWLYNSTEFTDIGDYIGFVYIITNIVNGRRYLGKKNFYFSKTRQIKGKKKKYKVESDWKEYFGSNEELKADVLNFGQECFKREIIRLCYSKSEFAYFEAKYQFEYGVLESDTWYNSWISFRLRKDHIRKIFKI